MLLRGNRPGSLSLPGFLRLCGQMMLFGVGSGNRRPTDDAGVWSTCEEAEAAL